MSEPQHPLLTAIAKAQYDLTSAQAWLSEVRRQIAAMNLIPVELPVCEFCGPLHLPPTTSMEDHMRNIHDVHAMPPPPVVLLAPGIERRGAA